MGVEEVGRALVEGERIWDFPGRFGITGTNGPRILATGPSENAIGGKA